VIARDGLEIGIEMGVREMRGRVSIPYCGTGCGKEFD
jgi:hypothetical protein